MNSRRDDLGVETAYADEIVGVHPGKAARPDQPVGPVAQDALDRGTCEQHAGLLVEQEVVLDVQRFVDKTPWAHLDIAGTGMNSQQTDINKSWGSGWGVRLLDRLVKDYYEG